WLWQRSRVTRRCPSWRASSECIRPRLVGGVSAFWTGPRNYLRMAGDGISLSKPLAKMNCTLRLAGCRWKSNGSKKKLPSSVAERRRWLDAEHPELSIRRQCALLGLNRSSGYYEPAPESATNLRLLRWLDEQYLKTPFYGSRQMASELRRQ